MMNDMAPIPLEHALRLSAADNGLLMVQAAATIDTLKGRIGDLERAQEEVALKDAAIEGLQGTLRSLMGLLGEAADLLDEFAPSDPRVLRIRATIGRRDA